MPARPTETFEILSLLCRRGVEFIVVGMTAGVLQGAPALTFDLDIVYSRAPENIGRLLGVLGEIDAVFRDDARRIPPNASHLESAGHKLLETSLGDLDVLGAIGVGLDYAALLPDAVVLVTSDLEVRVLGLARLIEVKEQAGRPKDLAALPVLRSTLERSAGRRPA